MKNSIIKILVVISILLLTVSCERYVYYHVGWSDFPQEEFKSLAPYSTGETITFASSNSIEITYTVESCEYYYGRTDKIGKYIDTIGYEDAIIEVILIGNDGCKINCVIQIYERHSIFISLKKYSSDGNYIFKLSNEIDIEIVNECYDFNIEETYIFSSDNYPLDFQNNSKYETIEYEIEKGIGVKRITLDDVDYLLAE